MTGASPVVDVRQVQQTQVVPRDMLDALPTGRNFRSMGTLITAVRPQRQNLGDSNPWAQTIAVRGMGTNGTVILIDGLSTNSMQTGFAAYTNDAAVQEISYQTSANTADVSYGGLRANMVPRDGGNTVRGGGFFSFLEGRWQADNLTPELQAKEVERVKKFESGMVVNPVIIEPTARLDTPITTDTAAFLSGRLLGLDEGGTDESGAEAVAGHRVGRLELGPGLVRPTESEKARPVLGPDAQPHRVGNSHGLIEHQEARPELVDRTSPSRPVSRSLAAEVREARPGHRGGRMPRPAGPSRDVESFAPCPLRIVGPAELEQGRGIVVECEHSLSVFGHPLPLDRDHLSKNHDRVGVRQRLALLGFGAGAEFIQQHQRLRPHVPQDRDDVRDVAAEGRQ